MDNSYSEKYVLYSSNFDYQGLEIQDPQEIIDFWNRDKEAKDTPVKEFPADQYDAAKASLEIHQSYYRLEHACCNRKCFCMGMIYTLAHERFLNGEFVEELGRDFAKWSTSVPVLLSGQYVNFAACKAIMDEELREGVRQDIAPCSNQDFLDEYCRRHRKKFGEAFDI